MLTENQRAGRAMKCPTEFSSDKAMACMLHLNEIQIER